MGPELTELWPFNCGLLIMALGKLPEILSTLLIVPYLALLIPAYTQAEPHVTR